MYQVKFSNQISLIDKTISNNHQFFVDVKIDSNLFPIISYTCRVLKNIIHIWCDWIIIMINKWMFKLPKLALWSHDEDFITNVKKCQYCLKLKRQQNISLILFEFCGIYHFTIWSLNMNINLQFYVQIKAFTCTSNTTGKSIASMCFLIDWSPNSQGWQKEECRLQSDK